MDINDFKSLDDAEKAEVTKQAKIQLAKHFAARLLIPAAVVITTHIIVKKLENSDDQTTD